MLDILFLPCAGIDLAGAGANYRWQYLFPQRRNKGTDSNCCGCGMPQHGDGGTATWDIIVEEMLFTSLHAMQVCRVLLRSLQEVRCKHVRLGDRQAELLPDLTLTSYDAASL